MQAYWAGEVAAAARIPRLPSLPAAQLGTRVLVAGTNLAGDAVSLRFTHPRRAGAQEILIPAADRNDRELRFTLPSDAAARDAWSTGVYAVQARVDRGGPMQGSNSIPFIVAPHVSAIAPNPAVRIGGAVTLTVTCHPKVLPDQTATLRLGDRDIAAQPHTNPSDTLEIFIANVSALADQLFRVRIDGIESFPLRYDAGVGGFVFDDSQRVTIA